MAPIHIVLPLSFLSCWHLCSGYEVQTSGISSLPSLLLSTVSHQVALCVGCTSLYPLVHFPFATGNLTLVNISYNTYLSKVTVK